LRKIRGEDVDGIARDPLRQIDGLVMPIIEDDKDAGFGACQRF
jgi:hypothetical protein